MFYEKQPLEHRNNYKKMLKIVGNLSRLFSDSKEPYLYYRAHEKIFSRYFDVKDISRNDDSADAFNSDEGIGIGLKTWVGSDTQKVAEFGRLRPSYENLSGIKLVEAISFYRNKRIQFTMNAHGVHTLIYHIIKRKQGIMSIYEAAFDEIDISNIKLLPDRGRENSEYFTDGRHIYNFLRSKNTLYMVFDEMEFVEEFEVEINEDPFALLEEISVSGEMPPIADIAPKERQLCLRLYSNSKKKGKYIPESSGLNQWNGFRSVYKRNSDGSHVRNGKGEKVLDRLIPRNANELYIPFPIEDRKRVENLDFFPPRNEKFDLILPNGKKIQAKVCQADGKAIMSDPNKELGRWLLRDVLELPEKTLVTYEMLKEFNIDCVIFTKLNHRAFSINFGELGTYENFYNLEDTEAYLDTPEDSSD